MSNKNSDFIIRPAGFEDTAGIFELIKSYPEELIPRSMSDIVENIDRFIVCTSPEGRIMGVVSWYILPEIGAPKQPSVEIKSLAVDSSCHGQGIGKKLINAAVEHIRPFHPAQIIALTFHPDFFLKNGFSEIDKESLIHKIYTGCKNCAKYDSPFTCPEKAVAMKIQNNS